MIFNTVVKGKGIDISQDTVTPEVLLSPYTAHDAAGEAIVGTMVNRGAVTGTISTKAGQYTIPAGYHNGSGKVGISSTEKNKIIASNIKSGVTLLGVSGTCSPDTFITATRTATVEVNSGTTYVYYFTTSGVYTSVTVTPSNSPYTISNIAGPSTLVMMADGDYPYADGLDYEDYEDYDDTNNDRYVTLYIVSG